jgi:hypothetical protein
MANPENIRTFVNETPQDVILSAASRARGIAGLGWTWGAVVLIVAVVSYLQLLNDGAPLSVNLSIPLAQVMVGGLIVAALLALSSNLQMRAHQLNMSLLPDERVGADID